VCGDAYLVDGRSTSMTDFRRVAARSAIATDAAVTINRPQRRQTNARSKAIAIQIAPTVPIRDSVSNSQFSAPVR
jgi:hypothetical protein